MNKPITCAKTNDLYIALIINNALGTPLYILKDFYKKLGFRNCNVIGIEANMYQ